ncbi:hypothetical protein BJY00DRAFT_295944 [Aspergillus carlsbadensis]|nr:hypothetical protein BJY00DRAFT_295944 [Aspergillus carlsbadensis]
MRYRCPPRRHYCCRRYGHLRPSLVNLAYLPGHTSTGYYAPRPDRAALVFFSKPRIREIA